MEIVLTVLGVVALVGLARMTLRMRTSRRIVRRSGAVQWRGSAGSARRAGRTRTAAAAVSAPTAYVAANGGGGTAVKDPPRTRVDEDAWDDDLEWTDTVDAAPATEAPRDGHSWGGAPSAPAARPEQGEELDEDPAPPEQDAPARWFDREAEAAAAAPAPVSPDTAPTEPEPEWDDDLHDPAPRALAPAAPARDEAAWDDDLARPPVRPKADGEGRPLPVSRGAAAFGAATATPPAPRKRANPLRSPVAMVAIYALAGIALVVLAVSLLADTVSPGKPKPTERARQSKPIAPAPAPVTTAPRQSSNDAAAAKRRQIAFQRAVSDAVAAQRASLRAAREARRLRIATRRRAAERRRSARARRSVAGPGRSTAPSYSAPAPSQAPAAPPSSGSGGGGSGGSGGGGGGGGCEFCIG